MTETTMPAPPPIDLEAFERMVYSGRNEDALRQLLTIIAGIKQGAGFTWTGGQTTMEALFTRLAAAITAVFADPQFDLSYDGFAILASHHPTFHSIFRVSSFRSTDYLLSLIGQRRPDAPDHIDFPTVGQLHKLMLCWSLDSSVEFSFDTLAQTMPEFVSAALVGILGIGGIHTERAYNRKVELLRRGSLLEKAVPHDSMVVPMCDVYMHCSYVDSDDKHEIKKVINRQMRRLMEAKIKEHGVTLTEHHTLVRKDRPTIVIPVEWFGSHHAMFRCYAHSIRQLREHFRVVCIAREQDVDEVSEKEFDKVVKIPPDKSSIFDMSQAVANEAPDIIFYPSIGMAGWWVALSNFRLAPLQIMCPGHPATTYSECIDYIVSDGDLFGDESRYSEKCVHLPVGTARYINSTKIDRAELTRPTDGIVRVAVPSMAMKLVPPFLKALKEISERVNVKCEFHFFPNMIAAFHHLITGDLQEWVKGCIVHDRKTYADYINTLSKCDIMLSSFPFCGTNSVIDCYLCGIPVIAMEGDQIHSRSGASMNRRVGLPEQMIAHSVEEYINSACYYIEVSAAREKWQKHLMEFDVEKEFYGDGPDELRGKFGQAFWEIYEREVAKHERQQRTRFLDPIAESSAGIAGTVDAGLALRPVG